MDLSTFIVAVFCLVDDRIADLGRLRARGPAPTLFDSEVITIEVVGEFLGIDEDTKLFAYFRRHYTHFFPNLLRVHRTTFCRQAANLWKVKERLWQELVTGTPHDPAFALIDSMPLPACLFARAYRCRRFKGEAAFGKDTLLKQTFYGFRVHARVCWPGVITRISVAPANAHELSVVPELTERTSGLIVGDRNYHSPKTRQELASIGAELLAPYSSKKRDPYPERSAFLSRLRYRIDTVFSQLTERYSVKKVWARDFWHLASRLLRKVLSHTVAFLLNHQMGNPHPYSSQSYSTENPHIGLAKLCKSTTYTTRSLKSTLEEFGIILGRRAIYLYDTVISFIVASRKWELGNPATSVASPGCRGGLASVP